MGAKQFDIPMENKITETVPSSPVIDETQGVCMSLLWISCLPHLHPKCESNIIEHLHIPSIDSMTTDLMNTLSSRENDFRVRGDPSRLSHQNASSSVTTLLSAMCVDMTVVRMWFACPSRLPLLCSSLLWMAEHPNCACQYVSLGRFKETTSA